MCGNSQHERLLAGVPQQACNVTAYFTTPKRIAALRPAWLAPQAPGGPREIECSLHVGDGLGGAGGGNELLKGVGGVVVSGTCCSTLAGRHLLVLDAANGLCTCTASFRFEGFFAPTGIGEVGF